MMGLAWHSARARATSLAGSFAALALGVALLAATVTGLRHGLLGLAPSVRVVIPWLPLAGIALACLAIAVLASLIPAALRRQPAELAAVPE